MNLVSEAFESIYLTCVGVGELLIITSHEAEAGEVFVLLIALRPCIFLLGTRAVSTRGRKVDVIEGCNTSTCDRFLDLPRGLVPPGGVALLLVVEAVVRVILLDVVIVALLLGEVSDIMV